MPQYLNINSHIEDTFKKNLQIENTITKFLQDKKYNNFLSVVKSQLLISKRKLFNS